MQSACFLTRRRNCSPATSLGTRAVDKPKAFRVDVVQKQLFSTSWCCCYIKLVMMAITFRNGKDGGKRGEWKDTLESKVKNDDNSDEGFYFGRGTCYSMFLPDLLFKRCTLIIPIQILKNESLVSLQCSAVWVTRDAFHSFPRTSNIEATVVI